MPVSKPMPVSKSLFEAAIDVDVEDDDGVAMSVSNVTPVSIAGIDEDPGVDEPGVDASVEADDRIGRVSKPIPVSMRPRR